MKLLKTLAGPIAIAAIGVGIMFIDSASIQNVFMLSAWLWVSMMALESIYFLLIQIGIRASMRIDDEKMSPEDRADWWLDGNDEPGYVHLIDTKKVEVAIAKRSHVVETLKRSVWKRRFVVAIQFASFVPYAASGHLIFAFVGSLVSISRCAAIIAASDLMDETK